LALEAAVAGPKKMMMISSALSLPEVKVEVKVAKAMN
jgi:hypothetical protein